MRYLAHLAALVIFVVVAILALTANSVSLRHLIGWLAIGLACFVVSAALPESWNRLP
jgi:hypothetical protein